MKGTRTAAVAAAAVLCSVALAPVPALAHGGAAAGGFARGGVPMRGIAFRSVRLRHSWRVRGRRFRFHHAQSGWGMGAFGPAYLLPDDPPGYGERFNEPRPPVWRECVSQSLMVPSSTHPGLTPVAITRCWRRY